MEYRIEADSVELLDPHVSMRAQGQEVQYDFVCEHDQLGTLTWTVWEYPSGAENSTDSDLNGHELVSDFRYGLMPDDYDDSDYDEAVNSGQIVDGDGEWPPIIATEQPLPSESEARQETVQRLDELEKAIAPLVAARGEIGHNQPPEAIDVELPPTQEEWSALKADVDALRHQTQLVGPSENQINQANSRIRKFGRKLADWLSKRLEKASDAFATTIGTGAGALFLACLAKALGAIDGLVHAATVWLQTLPSLF